MLLVSSFLWAEWEVVDVRLIFPHDSMAGIAGVSELHPNSRLPHREQPVLCLLCEGTVWEQCIYFLSPSFLCKGSNWSDWWCVLSSPSVVSNSLQPHGLQHTRLPCPSLSLWVCSNSCPLSQWCHPTISSSVAPFSSCPQSFPASESFSISQVFIAGGQSIVVSASVLPMNWIQGWFPLGLTGLISLLSKGLSRVFSSTTFQKYQFFGISGNWKGTIQPLSDFSLFRIIYSKRTFCHLAGPQLTGQSLHHVEMGREVQLQGKGCRSEHWSSDAFISSKFFRTRREYISLMALSKFCLVQFSHSFASDFLQTQGLQHIRPPCPSPTPRVYPNSYPLSRWCHPTISSSVVPFSSCPQSFPASGSFQMSQPFASGGQSTGVSASTSVLPMNAQDWSPLGWTGWTSLQSKGLSRFFSNTTVKKHQFFGTQLSSPSNSHIHTWLLEKP